MRKIKFLSIALILIVGMIFTFHSCQKDYENIDLSNEINNTQPLNRTKKVGEYIILGKERVIPYTVENLQNAVKYVNTNMINSPYINKTIYGTHYYIKFEPKTEEHLTALYNLEKQDSIVLSNFPLHYEIIQEGSYLKEDDPEKIKYQDIYCTVPKSFQLPNVPYTRIAEVYEPTDDEYNIEITALVLTGNEDKIDEQINGKPITISNLNEYLNSTTKSRKFTPQGRFVVYDTNGSNYVGVRNTTISIGRAIWWHTRITNDNGDFIDDRTYRGTVYVRAKWYNSNFTIRKTWNEVLGIGVGDYLMHLDRYNNGGWYVTEHSDSHKWYKATVNNSIYKYNTFMASKGVQGVRDNANIWVQEGEHTRGSTPMLKQFSNIIFNLDLSDWKLAKLLPSVFGSLGHLSSVLMYQYLAPDMTLSYEEKNTKIVDQLVFHEAGHFTHGKKVGGNYWGTFVNAELSNILNHDKDPYFDGISPSQFSGKLIALAEGWATFTEHAVLRGYYTTTSSGFEITTHMENFKMYVTPDNIINENLGVDDSWFLTGLLWDIIDNSTESGSWLFNRNVTPITATPIIDNLSIGNFENNFHFLFNRFTNQVYTGNDLKIALRNTYTSSTNQINQLFESYGY